MIENPNFYAIIPANVRYSDITPNAKLLYGEITALCNKTGYCFATNDYFAKLYKVSKVSVSKWIKELVENGFITSEIEYGPNKEILNRYLRIFNDPIKEKFNTPIKEKLMDNNTRFNNTSNNKEKNKKEDEFLEEVKESPIYDAFRLWLDYKKERGQTYKFIGLKGAFEKLQKFSNGNELIANDIINEAISNNWSGFFAKKAIEQRKIHAEEVDDHNLKRIKEVFGVDF